MKVRISIVHTLFCLFFMARVFSQDAVIRPILGIGAGHMFLTGSFNGSSFFETDEDILLVPKINPAFGFGGVAGLSVNDGAFEMSYYRYESEYTTMEEEYSGKCVSHLVRFLGISRDLNAIAKGRINPYIDLDFSVAFTKFDKVAYPIYQSSDPSPASYTGLIFGFGGGFRAWISEGFALDLRVLPEYYMGTDIKVKGRDRYEISKFGNFLLHTTLSLKYYFKPV